jgi:hypothetical protein
MRRHGWTAIPPELYQQYHEYSPDMKFHPLDWWHNDSENSSNLSLPRGEQLSEEGLWEVVTWNNEEEQWTIIPMDKNSDGYKISMAKCALSVNGAAMSLFGTAITLEAITRDCYPKWTLGCGQDCSGMISTTLGFVNFAAFSPAFCGPMANQEAFCTGDWAGIIGGIADATSSSLGLADSCPQSNKTDLAPIVPDLDRRLVASSRTEKPNWEEFEKWQTEHLERLHATFEPLWKKVEEINGPFPENDEDEQDNDESLDPFFRRLGPVSYVRKGIEGMKYTARRGGHLFQRHKQTQKRIRHLMKGRSLQEIMAEWADRYKIDPEITPKQLEAQLDAELASDQKEHGRQLRTGRSSVMSKLSCAQAAETTVATLVSSYFSGWTLSKVCANPQGKEEAETCASNSIAMANYAPDLTAKAVSLSNSCANNSRDSASCVGNAASLAGTLLAWGGTGATINQDCEDSPGWGGPHANDDRRLTASSAWKTFGGGALTSSIVVAMWRVV